MRQRPAPLPPITHPPPRSAVTISNDGATIVNLLDIVHPAARTLVDIAKSQDAEVRLAAAFAACARCVAAWASP